MHVRGVGRGARTLCIRVGGQGVWLAESCGAGEVGLGGKGGAGFVGLGAEGGWGRFVGLGVGLLGVGFMGECWAHYPCMLGQPWPVLDIRFELLTQSAEVRIAEESGVILLALQVSRRATCSFCNWSAC